MEAARGSRRESVLSSANAAHGAMKRTLIMGILNVTPDSFSDGGIFLARDDALRQAERMVAEGADIIDVGGESTRPGAVPVSLQAELDRVLPVIALLRERVGAPISVDTSKPEVMEAAIAAGASVVNDVNALRTPGAREVVARHKVAACLMHMQGEPRSMQTAPQYAEVVQEVRDFLLAQIGACEAAGIPRARLWVDPGFGFGKTLAHNVALLRGLQAIADIGLPVLVGLSRKSMIGQAIGLPVGERAHASAALALMAVQNGASIVRVHDVRPTADALRMFEAVYAESLEQFDRNDN